MIQMLRRVPTIEIRAVLISLLVGISLMGIKFAAYFLTGSAAIFSDALESIVNVAASSVAFYSLVVAHAPADAEHPYGHGKVEFMSAAFEGGMIVIASIVMTIKAIDNWRHLVQLEALGVGMILMAFAMAVNGAVGLFLIRTGRRQRSLALEADGHHLISDAVTSVVALIALMAVRATGQLWLDPVFAILIAGYIGWMGVRLLRRSAAGLMDKQDIEDERTLRRILDEHIGPEGREPRICSYHKLRHRHSGRYHWVDFHMMVPAHISIAEGHAVASRIEYEIEQALGEANATAHIEPCPEVPCRLAPEQADGCPGN